MNLNNNNNNQNLGKINVRTRVFLPTFIEVAAAFQIYIKHWTSKNINGSIVFISDVAAARNEHSQARKPSYLIFAKELKNVKEFQIVYFTKQKQNKTRATASTMNQSSTPGK